METPRGGLDFVGDRETDLFLGREFCMASGKGIGVRPLVIDDVLPSEDSDVDAPDGIA